MKKMYCDKKNNRVFFTTLWPSSRRLPGARHAIASRQIFENEDVFPSVAFKQHFQGSALRIAVLHKQQAARFEGHESLLSHGYQVFQPFRPVWGNGRGGLVSGAVIMMVVMAGDFIRVHKIRDERRDGFKITDFGGEPFVFGLAT